MVYGLATAIDMAPNPFIRISDSQDKRFVTGVPGGGSEGIFVFDRRTVLGPVPARMVGGLVYFCFFVLAYVVLRGFQCFDKV